MDQPVVRRSQAPHTFGPLSLLERLRPPWATHPRPLLTAPTPMGNGPNLSFLPLSLLMFAPLADSQVGGSSLSLGVFPPPFNTKFTAWRTGSTPPFVSPTNRSRLPLSFLPLALAEMTYLPFLPKSTSPRPPLPFSGMTRTTASSTPSRSQGLIHPLSTPLSPSPAPRGPG